MTRPAKLPPPERFETDASLRAERDKTDEEIARRRGARVGAADRVVEQARARADLLLSRARAVADHTIAQQAAPAASGARVAAERAHADVVVSEERRAADESLRS